MNIKKLKDKWVWAAILAQILTILSVSNVIPQADIEVINLIAEAVLQILVLLGILNASGEEKF